MKWRVLVRPRGEADLREIREWYEEQRAGLGAEFLAELTRAMQDLGDRSGAPRSLLSRFSAAADATFPI